MVIVKIKLIVLGTSFKLREVPKELGIWLLLFSSTVSDEL